jgi:peptidase C39-like protein
MTPRRRRVGPWRIVLVVGIVGVALGFGAVATNAFGAGDKFERLIAKIDRLIVGTPPPDRPTRPTVDVTPQPSAEPTPTPTPASLPPGATPTPAPTPVPRVAVDYVLPVEPNSVFAHELRKDWCAPAGVQMTLATLGLGNTTEDFQREIAGRIHEWETYADSHNYEWGPAAMADALAAYGAPGYEIHAFRSRGDAVRDAAIAIKKTGSPVILLAWKGAHTWVMTGYRAEADPTAFPDAVMTGAYILDPWYPWNSSIWGPSDPPGTFQDWPEMERNFLPWKRPEGTYPDRDGKYIIVVPTLPAPGTN